MASPRFLDAVRYATLKHANQRRKAANSRVVPYMVHPLEAAQILAEVGVRDDDVLIAAVLHDILEDTDGTEEDILYKFGEKVLAIVKEVTDDPRLSKNEQKREQVRCASTKSYAAKLVKAADKTSNMRDLVRNPPGWKISSMRGYTAHAREVVLALNDENELPQALKTMFWNASQDVLDWCNEQEFRKEEGIV